MLSLSSVNEVRPTDPHHTSSLSLPLSHSKVAYLECDIGQPEFTVAGVVALNIVTEPLVGPAFTHLREPFM